MPLDRRGFQRITEDRADEIDEAARSALPEKHNLFGSPQSDWGDILFLILGCEKAIFQETGIAQTERMPADLTILIVSYNTRELLESCLRSLQRVYSERAFDLIVVDNASSDGSAELPKTYFPHASVIKLDKNIGFASAINRGMESVRSRFILILNPDTLIPRGSVTKLVSFLNKNGNAGIVGAAMTDIDGTPQTSTFKFPSLFREFWNFLPEVKSVIHLRQAALRLGWARRTRLIDHHDPTAIPVESISGAAMAVRTDALRAVGGFDERFFLYHEEMDLCTRLRKDGWGVYFIPGVQIIHWEARASGYRYNRMPSMPLLSWRIGGMDLLWFKHKSLLEHRLWRILAKTLLGLRIAFNTILLCLPLPNRTERKRRRADYISAIGILRRKLGVETVSG